MSGITVSVHTADPPECEQWRAQLQSALGDGFRVVTGADPRAHYAVAWAPSAGFFTAQPALRAVFSMAAGVDHLLGIDTLPQMLPIYRLEDAGMGAQMIRYCRHEVEHLLLDRHRYGRQQRDASWHQHPVREPAELTVGLFGYGVLGQRVARALADEGYRVRAFRRRVDQRVHEDITEFAGQAQWPSFLNGLQVLILLAPLTAQTRGIIDGAVFDAMAKNSWLINVGRGALLDEPALLEALGDGRLAGASLDVSAREPLPGDHPFWLHPQIRITPHVAAVTLIGPSARQIAARIAALERGEPVGRSVDRSSGY
ncbi:MAG: NAD(P)-dependent oxidoreductase [Burkholderiaceae bacterium]